MVFPSTLSLYEKCNLSFFQGIWIVSRGLHDTRNFCQDLFPAVFASAGTGKRRSFAVDSKTLLGASQKKQSSAEILSAL